MRIVLQKVSEGSVDVVDETSGEVDTTFEPQHIGIGYVLLVGVEDTDGAKQIDWPPPAPHDPTTSPDSRTATPTTPHYPDHDLRAALAGPRS